MDKEDLNLAEIKGPDIAADDVKFMRSVVERTDRQVRPEGYVLTACGLMLSNLLHCSAFSAQIRAAKVAIACVSDSDGHFPGIYVFCTNAWGKTSKERRLCSADTQAAYYDMVHSCITHNRMEHTGGGVLNNYCGGDPGFIAAMGLSIALSATGILYSREYLYGGLFIFACMFLTYFAKDYGYIILGVATATGSIVPELICRWKFNRQVQGNG
jgi:hypothetical protein